MNNAAIIARVERTHAIPGADRIQLAEVLGEFCVVSKDVNAGDIGILFPEGLELSESFVFENSLSRRPENNKDNKTGFFDANRRVRAQPFLKQKSTAFFGNKDMVAYTGVDMSSLVLGSTFNDLNGVGICKKYVNPETARAAKTGLAKTSKKHLAPNFLEHVETSQFNFNVNRIKKGDLIFFHAKKHGTSGRSAKTRVYHPLPKWKQIVNKFLPVFDEFNWEYVTGTRRTVIFDGVNKKGHHGSEDFRQSISNKLKPYLTNGMTLYYEIVGYANGSPIMQPHNIQSLKDKEYTKKYGNVIEYKYGLMPDLCDFRIYRATIEGVDGVTRDMSQFSLEAFCERNGLKCAHEIHEPMLYDGDEDSLKALVKRLTDRPEVLTEDYEDPSHISEGIILRIENGSPTPTFLKSKSYAFKVCEGIAAVEGGADLEDAS